MSLSFKKVVLMALVISGMNLQAGNRYTEKQFLGDFAGFAAGVAAGVIPLTAAYIKLLKELGEKETSHAKNKEEAILTALYRALASGHAKLAQDAVIAIGTASLVMSTICHFDKNARYYQIAGNILQPVILGASTGFIVGHRSDVAQATAAALVTSYALAKKYSSDENRVRNTWGIAAAAALTAGIKYSSDNGTEVSLFGIPVWTSAQAEQTAPAA